MNNSDYFKEHGYVVVRNFISKDVCELLKYAFLIERDVMHFVNKQQNKNAYGDAQILQSYSSYAFVGFESLMYNSKSKMEENTGLSLLPTYSYARVYYKDSELEPHTDRESCEISSTVCIDKTSEYPFFVRNRSGQDIKVEMEVGDAVIYSGCELTHWREKYNGEGHIQTFIHYVDANGPHKNFVLDGRPMFGLQRG